MSVVHVVHCVDTEGPLTETIEQTFGRLRAMFDVTLAPDADTLARLQRGEIELGGRESEVALALAPHLLAYNRDWGMIGAMLARFWSAPAQDALRDPEGRPWTTTWFCCDHVDYRENPQGRDIGYHKVFDFYRDALAARAESADEIEFHFHPRPLSGRANSNATHWFANEPTLFQTLARRILDRMWFPAANRPGFHVTRPDSHWFLEQFIPFDYANQAMRDADGGEQRDVGGGRFGDWRRASRAWRPYHPAHDDYQIPGGCRRAILRCLNVGTRFRLLTQADVDQAFAEARAHGVAALAFTNHDFRDIGPDCEAVARMVRRAAAAHPDVSWRHATAREAARDAVGVDPGPGAGDFLRIRIEGAALHVRATRPIFGPQPFLAIKAADGRYFHDAFDWTVEPGGWSYTFDQHTLPLARIAAVGVAAADPAGHVSVARWRAGGEIDHAHR